MAASNVETKEEEEETDSSGSEYDDVDTGIFRKAKRKIFKVFKKINPFEDVSGKYKLQTEKLYNAKSSNVYDFNHEKRGCCIIINNDKFIEMGDRPGSTEDVFNMKTEFKNLGFDVKIYDNLSASYIHKKLRKVSMKYEHEKADCFVCIVLSHGGEDVDLKRERKDLIYGTDSHYITVAEIMEIFSDPHCPGLLGKPRLFFIQACRGDQREKGVGVKIKVPKEVVLHSNKPIDRKFIYGTCSGEGNVDAEDGKVVKVLDDIRKMTIDSDEEEDFIKYKKGLDNPISTPSPCYTDSLVMFASPPGYYAFRRESGTWFIKSLTYVLQNSPPSKTFQQMLTQVSYEMAMNYQSKNKKKPDIDGCVTLPCIMSMLTKDIYFHPQ